MKRKRESVKGELVLRKKSKKEWEKTKKQKKKKKKKKKKRHRLLPQLQLRIV
jgi:hypothetical protein